MTNNGSIFTLLLVIPDLSCRYIIVISLDLYPKCAAYYGNRAAAYMMLQDFTNALKDARTAFTLDSSFVKAYHRAAKCYIATGQTSQAFQTLQTAQTLEPKNKLILDEVIFIYLLLQDF